MLIGIDPTNDFAFKILFGQVEQATITIHFLNAVLKPQEPLKHIEFRNPILDKDFEGDKAPVLDVLAEDEAGRQFNIEMQSTLPAGLPKRLTYYASSLYTMPMTRGVDYTSLESAISICVLKKSLFPRISQLHFDFRLRQADGLLLTDSLQIHLVELAKSRAKGDNLKNLDPLELWAYFLSNAHLHTIEEIEQLLPDKIFWKAARVLQMIARDPQLQWQYYARQKAELDEKARNEYARQEGKSIGEILAWQRLLGDQVSTDAELESLGADALLKLRTDLQARVRQRGWEV